jgi:hypothetical protein
MKGNKFVVMPNNSTTFNQNNIQKCQKILPYNCLIDFPKLKFCFLYLLFLIGIFVIFILNYIYTINAFEKNNFVNLNPEKICLKNINLFTECLKTNLKYDKCVYENKAVEDCYDETSSMNRICYVYLSEVDLCINNNKFGKEVSQLNKTLKNICGVQMDEVIQCSKIYKYVKLDKDKILEHFI